MVSTLSLLIRCNQARSTEQYLASGISLLSMTGKLFQVSHVDDSPLVSSAWLSVVTMGGWWCQQWASGAGTQAQANAALGEF